MDSYKPGTIIRHVKPVREEKTKGQDVFVYWLAQDSRVKGLIFPNDDVIDITDRYDVVVTNVREKQNGILLLSEVYHELERGYSTIAKISGKGREGSPMFKLHGYLVFIKDTTNQLDIGDVVLAKIDRVKGGRNPKDKIALAHLEEIVSLHSN